MQNIKYFLMGANCIIRGIKLFYSEKNLWKYSLYPLPFLAITYIFVSIIFFYIGNNLIAYLTNLELSIFFEILTTIMSIIIYIGLFIVLKFIILSGFVTIYEIFGGLFFDNMLSEVEIKYLKIINSTTKINNVKQYWVISTIFNFNTFLIMIALSFFNLAIPIFGVLISIGILGYRFAISYSMGIAFKHNINLQTLKQILSNNIAYTLGAGVTIYFLFMIPLAIIFFIPGIIIGGVLFFHSIPNRNPTEL
ncbi:MAG: EI24 domain-containing protein [Lentisphaeria bacterium]|nr:EI24 domain-containing protein [Lentisphaeria bacterium]